MIYPIALAYGHFDAPIQNCSAPIAAYNWARTPGFNQMLPTYASSKHVNQLFLAFFILCAISFISSFLLWLTTLLHCCKSYYYYSIIVFLTIMSVLNVIIMLIVLILSLIIVISSAKAMTRASIYWNGYAGNAIWLTIASVFTWLFAATCYVIILRIYSNKSSKSSPRIHPISSRPQKERKEGYQHYDYDPFDLTHYHQPYRLHRQQQFSLNHHHYHHPQPTLPQLYSTHEGLPTQHYTTPMFTNKPNTIINNHSNEKHYY
ncbi:uncharacterized protein BX663DRAFT_552077 [Cokeromyces recurvatus]|uniref:uncharacterized protein n=1 Tax=Cokeromyces recurvatus TaxID=90255 RepID=UPI00221E5C68|nr:uncharacterized protein BX663DRAFT_552077 [Cokeromyces recurvatus]KAI7902670.1 hypothetical protein BX663DRAFT_552077 [Cokeromyces recurvatus]